MIIPFKTSSRSYSYLWHHRGYCTQCGNESDHYIYSKNFRFRINFIPVINIPQEYYVSCARCGGAYQTDRNDWNSAKSQNFSNPQNVPSEAVMAEYSFKETGLLKSALAAALFGAIEIFFLILTLDMLIYDGEALFMSTVLIFAFPLIAVLPDFLLALRKYIVYRKLKKSLNL